ncbi:MAG: hypothetical protein ACREKM_12310 [Longimicrobiales bacterium]
MGKTHEGPNKRRRDAVVALLPGSDPSLRDEIVVIGARYDHLGHSIGSLTT